MESYSISTLWYHFYNINVIIHARMVLVKAVLVGVRVVSKSSWDTNQGKDAVW